MGSVGEGRFGAPKGVTGWGLGQGEAWSCCALALLTAIFLSLGFFCLFAGGHGRVGRAWLQCQPLWEVGDSSARAGAGRAVGDSRPHRGRARVGCFIYNNLLERMARVSCRGSTGLGSPARSQGTHQGPCLGPAPRAAMWHMSIPIKHGARAGCVVCVGLTRGSKCWGGSSEVRASLCQWLGGSQPLGAHRGRNDFPRLWLCWWAEGGLDSSHPRPALLSSPSVATSQSPLGNGSWQELAQTVPWHHPQSSPGDSSSSVAKGD